MGGARTNNGRKPVTRLAHIHRVWKNRYRYYTLKRNIFSVASWCVPLALIGFATAFWSCLFIFLTCNLAAGVAIRYAAIRLAGTILDDLELLDYTMGDAPFFPYVGGRKRKRYFLGRMNCYGSEGPRRYTRATRAQKQSNLTFRTGNKTSFNSTVHAIATTDAHIVALQETMLNDQKFWNTKRWLKAGTYDRDADEDTRHQSWRAEGSPAQTGPGGGSSAGVMLLSKPHIDITPVAITDGIESNRRNPYEIIPGRLTAMVVNGWLRSRFITMSVYMDVHSKLGATNRLILFTIGLVVAVNALPFVALGDWNMPPETLASTGWLDTVSAYVVAPEQPTCITRADRSGSIIDYAVVSNPIVPMVRHCEIVKDDVYQPHCFVELQLHHGTINVRETKIIKPRSFPDTRPIGPVNRPVQPIEELKPTSPVTLEEHADWVTKLVEQELIYVYHADWERDADDLSPYAGRAKGLNLKAASYSLPRLVSAATILCKKGLCLR